MPRCYLLLSAAVFTAVPLAPALAQNSPPPVFRIQRVLAAPQATQPAAPRAADAIQTEIVPPPEVQTRADADSVVLKSGSSAATVRSLPVRRQMPLAQVRAAPVLMVGATKMDLAPTLANPKALFNVAQRIRERPNLAEVLVDDTKVYEIDQGLVIRSFLNYRVRPGVCADARRTALVSTGLNCATQLTVQARDAAFANRNDPHYVPPRMRAAAIAKANENAAQIEQDLAQSVGEVRAMLADPARRGEFDAQMGPGSADRLAGLSDDQLKAEIVNSGETAVEQTFFIPKLDRVHPELSQKYPTRNQLHPKPATTPPMLLGGLKMAPQGINPAILGAIAATQPVPTNTPIPERIFLTGFTLGKAYEWNQRVEKTIKTCLVSCKKTYYAEVFAGFNYGFGLRFPIRLGGTYTFKPETAGSGKSASVKTDFVPVNGNEQQYLDTGLPADKLFGGKELVAQVGAHAGAGYKLPIIGSDSIDIAVGVDFTEDLPGDFDLGQFTPPAPGSNDNPKAEKVFYDLDLIGGRANFGAIGAQVFPAVRVELTSDKLTFTLRDLVSNQETLLTTSGQVTKLAIEKGDQSRFSIGDPKYNLAFLITPGLTARLFVDLALWSQNWDFPVWFPQLALKLPPDGAEFGCHDGTECSRQYAVSPAGLTTKAGPQAGLPTDLDNWGAGLDAKYIPQCADEVCRIGVRFVRQGTIYSALHKWDANNALTLANFSADLQKADFDARQLVDEAQLRQTRKASDSFGILYQEVWSKRCSDKICMDKVKGIIAFHRAEINAQQKLNPDKGTNEILSEVGKKFVPIYQAEIDASKARAAAEQAAAAKRAVRQTPMPVMKVLGN